MFKVTLEAEPGPLRAPGPRRARWEDKSGPPSGSWVRELGLYRQLSTWLTCPTCSIDSGPGPELSGSGELRERPKQPPAACHRCPAFVPSLCGSDPLSYSLHLGA